MSSLVSDFIINPVLRQARRFSEISRSTFGGDVDDHAQHANAVTDSSPVEDSVPASRAIESPVTRPLLIPSPVPRIEHTPSPVMAEGTPTQDRIALALGSTGSRRLPEDDGMGELRSRIQLINAQDISSNEKARLMHETLLEGYRARTASHVRSSSQSSDNSAPNPEKSPATQSLKFWADAPSSEHFNLSEDDIKPTYVPVKQHKHHGHEAFDSSPEPMLEDDQPLGCAHYERNVKLECSTCKKWYTCRFCHDANEDHNLVRTETKHMLCMLCGTPQKASDLCINCGEIAAHYYCNICKLWENRQHKPVYHCNDCGICRRGLGLGKDFFHCKICRACISTSIESSHKCIERSTDCDCPICGDYLFTSPKPVVFMACGHSIHKRCYDAHMKVSYKCPICNKSLANMESQFRNLDVAIQAQPMPPEFQDTTAVILCNDCSGKSTVRYHWLGLKCSICRSYNTVELQILGPDHRQVQPTMTETGEPVDAAAETQFMEVRSTEPAEPSTASTVATRAINISMGRRRHSSHAAEAPFQAPDRVARSLTPLNLGIDTILGLLSTDGESDDDILGIWRGRDLDNDDNGSTVQDDSETDDDISEDMSDAEEEEEEDDDNEIILIGHR